MHSSGITFEICRTKEEVDPRITYQTATKITPFYKLELFSSSCFQILNEAKLLKEKKTLTVPPLLLFGKLLTLKASLPFFMFRELNNEKSERESKNKTPPPSLPIPHVQFFSKKRDHLRLFFLTLKSLLSS